MRRAALTLALLIPACLPDPNQRAELAEVRCSPEQGCWGRWESTDAWTPVLPVAELDGAAGVVDVWSCEPDPDVDGCDVIDGVGHVMCWRDHDGWAAAVAPECAIVDWHTWHPVGLEMAAWVLPGGPWS